MGSQRVEPGELGQAIVNFYQQNLEKYQPSSKELREVATRIGIMLETAIKMNIRKERIIDTGRLLNSIFYQVRQTSSGELRVRVGSRGVPYAAIHEFGGIFTDRMRRAMFANLRRQGRLGRGPGPRKNVIQGRQFRARPYLRPAVQQSLPEIRRILKRLTT